MTGLDALTTAGEMSDPIPEPPGSRRSARARPCRGRGDALGRHVGEAQLEVEGSQQPQPGLRGEREGGVPLDLDVRRRQIPVSVDTDVQVGDRPEPASIAWKSGISSGPAEMFVAGPLPVRRTVASGPSLVIVQTAAAGVPAW